MLEMSKFEYLCILVAKTWTNINEILIAAQCYYLIQAFENKYIFALFCIVLTVSLNNVFTFH